MRLLFITYEFPPKGGVGVQRPLATARYLAEAGWDVTVLTVADPPTSLRDDALLSGLPEAVRVERAWSLEPTRVVQGLRRVRSRLGSGPTGTFVRRLRNGLTSVPVGPEPSRAAEGRGAASAPVSRGYTSLSPRAIRLVQALFVPDEKYWWTPFAVRLGKRLHREAAFDCILASGPPFTALGVARRLSRSCGIPWVADLRDPITDGCFFRPLTPLHRSLMYAFERRTLRSASRVITVTEGMREAIGRRLPDVFGKVTTITNGFDPSVFAGPAPAPRADFELAYVGTFQRPITPDVFLAAFAEARTRNPAFAARARIAFIGARDAATDEAVAASGLADAVERTGFVPHGQAIERMRAASVLLLLLGSGPENRLNLSGKLPEYLGTGRPVLALIPPDGVAADVIRRSGAGWVLAPDDVEGATAALLESFAEWQTGTLPEPDPDVVASFERSRLVAQTRELLAAAVAESGARSDASARPGSGAKSGPDAASGSSAKSESSTR